MANEKKKIQFLLSPKDVDELERLRIEAGAGTLAEVIRHALSWYGWSLRQYQRGKEIQVVEADGSVKTVVFSGFSRYSDN